MIQKEATSNTIVTPYVTAFLLYNYHLDCPKLVQMISSGSGASVMMAIVYYSTYPFLTL